jgi:hypothetical protein
MLRMTLVALLLVMFAGTASSQELKLPPDALKTYEWSRNVVAKPNESCKSQNDEWEASCLRRTKGGQCYNDYAQRVEYCKQSGFYLWINSTNVKVGKRE